MDKFYGFDLGDAESAVSVLEKQDAKTAPAIIPVGEAKSFITAYAATSDGQLLIGENACLAASVVKRRLRFKSRFLTDPSSAADIKSFAAGVLGELYANGDLIKGTDCCFYVGCPAGWDRNAREVYRAIFEKAGYPPVKIISESRAALVSACQSKHLQVGYDILSKPVLVVDIGSSTTDFAYVCGGKEVEMRTAGEVSLGGGIMDEILLEESIMRSDHPAEIRRVFEESEPWRNYCEFAARRLKERYFSDMEYFSGEPCTETVLIRYDRPLRLKIEMNTKMAELLLNKPSKRLGGKSFREVFVGSLLDVRESIAGNDTGTASNRITRNAGTPAGRDAVIAGNVLPELLFLTGGVSRLPEVRKWCIEAFPESIIITGTEPEFSVSRGLAYCGRIDDELREFRSEIEDLKNSRTIEDIVALNIDELYRMAVETLVEPILENAALPLFDRWRSGEIERLSDTDAELQRAITEYLQSEEARELLVEPISKWLKVIADALEEYTVPICIRHNVPYTALSLSSYLSVSDIDIKLDARNMFAVEEITLMIDSIISLLVGLICGGSGIAVISAGPNGIIAGAFVSLLVLILGKKKMEKAFLDMKIPGPMRKLISRSAFKSRLSMISNSVRKDLYKNLGEVKNEEITERMVGEISDQIELCLTKMAAVVEIPLG